MAFRFKSIHPLLPNINDTDNSLDEVLLSDVKFLSGSGQFIKASVDANIVNTTSSDIKFSGDIDVVYGSTKVCYCIFPSVFTLIWAY